MNIQVLTILTIISATPVCHSYAVHKHVPRIDYTNVPFHSDRCDWTGSGSVQPVQYSFHHNTTASESERSIVPIYLRCSFGTVRWFYPSGGLQIILRLAEKGNFRGCLQVNGQSTPKVRIYVQGQHELHQINVSQVKDQDNSKSMCFTSVNGFAGLFVEAVTTSTEKFDYQDSAATFSYELEPISDELDECRPCTDQELAEQFCSAYFALTGNVVQYQNKPEMDVTGFIVRPTFIHRFRSPIDPLSSTNYIQNLNMSALHDLWDNSIESSVNLNQYSDLSLITLYRPIQCASRASFFDEYLFLGRSKFNKLYITCAARVHHWKQVKESTEIAGRNQCRLS